jgi:hypothetical protein
MMDGESSKVLTLTLVCAPQEAGYIDRSADEISDPEDPRYGVFLTYERLTELVKLRPEDRATLDAWIAENGMQTLPSPGVNPQLIFVRATEEQVQMAFGSNLAARLMRVPDKEKKGARMVMHIPLRVAGYIQKVGGLPGEQGQQGVEISGVSGIDMGETAGLEAGIAATETGKVPDALIFARFTIFRSNGPAKARRSA